MAFNLERISSTQNSQREDFQCHWSPTSQDYTSAEVLLWYLSQGWALDSIVTIETYYLGGHRHSDIYHFSLKSMDGFITIPVLANPVVRHIINEYQLFVAEKQNSDSSFDSLLQNSEAWS